MIFRSPADSIIMRSKDSSHKGNTVAAMPGAFAEVKFDAHDSTFMMFYTACENPGCSCTGVVVTFPGKRSKSKPEHPRMEFGVEINVDTWKVGRIYGESSFAGRLIDEFVSGLNADHKNDILAKYRSFRLAVEN